MTVIGEWSLPVLISALKPRYHISSPLSISGGGVIVWFWWAPGIYPGLTKTVQNQEFLQYCFQELLS